ncbi:hypothetical protein AB6A40_002140 [Gnathostoma spinigerum]|uniref:G-protein coupled receptors family 1 profile domain-containing protein n=1 Tax=Gnathostoma spinigerum TaxID=75299 RepID=A0ABD6EDH4_9BILA
MMGSRVCEIGSISLPNITWLISAIADIHVAYGAVHPYIAMFLCIAGTLLNIVTILVLTRPTMLSPVNLLLCAVAVCDIAVMTSYLVFVSHFLINAAKRCETDDYSFAWAVFTLFHAHASVIFHATSIWLTVSLAQIRVLTISRATSGPAKGVTIPFTVGLSIVTWLIIICVNVPNFLTFEIVEMPAIELLSCLIETDYTHFNESVPSIADIQPRSETDITSSFGSVFMVSASGGDCMKLKLAFWSNGILFKVVPCILLTLSIIALLKIISDVSNRRKALAHVMKKKVPKDRTTPMLVAVLSIFLLAELPQGVMSVLTGVYTSDTFHQKIYLPLGDIMDLLSLLNSAVNFIIYCSMSRKFRVVFLQIISVCLPETILRNKSFAIKSKDLKEFSRLQPEHPSEYPDTEQMALTSQRRTTATSIYNSVPIPQKDPIQKYGRFLTVTNTYTTNEPLIITMSESDASKTENDNKQNKNDNHSLTFLQHCPTSSQKPKQRQSIMRQQSCNTVVRVGGMLPNIPQCSPSETQKLSTTRFRFPFLTGKSM